MKKLDNRGFTLVELLATLAVLSLVSTIVIYVAINVVNSAKDKSYLVTINDVEDAAVSYLRENSDKVRFVKYDDDIEYQCITVQNLIDTNYFDKDVLNSKISKDKTIRSNNYIYIERDSNNKTVTNSKLIADSNSDYNTLCGKASLDGNIEFMISPNGFAREKNVDIKYCLYNVSDYKNVEYFSQYNDLIYNDGNSDNTFSDNCLIRKVTVNENGDMIAKILKRNTDGNKEEVKSAIAKVSSIDNTAPVIKIEPNGDNTYTKSKTININISDDLSGVSSDSTIKYGFSKSKNEEPGSYKEVKVNGDIKIIESSLTGEYYLWIKPNVKDNAGNVNNDTLISDVYKFDKTAPSIPTYIAKYRDGSGRYTSGSTANKEVVTEISATDPDSGVEGIYYSKDKINKTKFNFGVSALTQNGSTWSGTESWDFRDGRNDGYYFMACDKVGNCSDWSSIFNIKYKTNKVYIKYHSNGGSMSNNNSNYTINSTSKLIEYNGNSKFHSVSYGNSLGSNGLYDANNLKYINLIRTGYSVVSGKEWYIKSDGSEKYYNQTKQYKANDFCDASNNDCEVTLYANWKINKLYIRYHANGGSMATNHGVNYSISNDVVVYKNTSGNYETRFHSVKYGEKIDFYNTNNSSYINLVRTGYSIVSGSEWCTKNDGSGTCYNQVSEYLATYICSSLKTGNCTIDLYANWKKKNTCPSGYVESSTKYDCEKVTNPTKKYTKTTTKCASTGKYKCSTSPTISDKHTFKCSCPDGTDLRGYYGNNANCTPSASGQRGRYAICRYYECPEGYTKSGSKTSATCYKAGQTSCPSGYTKTKEYKFKDSTSTVSSCTKGSSFTCNSSNSGKSYVSNCKVISTTCLDGNYDSRYDKCYAYASYE